MVAAKMRRNDTLPFEQFFSTLVGVLLADISPLRFFHLQADSKFALRKPLRVVPTPLKPVYNQPDPMAD